jgi:hypothetical protein
MRHDNTCHQHCKHAAHIQHLWNQVTEYSKQVDDHNFSHRIAHKAEGAEHPGAQQRYKPANYDRYHDSIQELPQDFDHRKPINAIVPGRQRGRMFCAVLEDTTCNR